MDRKFNVLDKVVTKDGVKCVVMFYDKEYHGLLWVQGPGGKTNIFSVFEDEVEEVKE